MSRIGQEDREAPRGVRELARRCREHKIVHVAFMSLVLAGCGTAISAEPATTDEAAQTSDGENEASKDPTPVTPPVANAADAATDAGDTDAGNDGATATPVTAAALLAKLGTCSTLSTAPYAKDASGTANLDVCGLTNAVYFNADMDIDCDGKSSAVCNASTDPSYQSQTAATDSKGAYLDAASLPFVVVPGVSSRWSYKTAGIAMGSVVAVIYNGKLAYGIVGDVGPTSILGEASYAMAKSLGINSNPATGGVSSGVTYIVFTGTSGKVSKKEDHAEAVSVGQQRAAQLLAEN